MARVYSGTTGGGATSATRYHTHGTRVPVSNHPFTIEGFIKPATDITTEQAVVSLADITSTNGTGWWMEVEGGGIRCTISTNAQYIVTTSLAIRARQWNHVACVFTSTTSRTAFANGIFGTTETTNRDPGANPITTFVIGAFRQRVAGVDTINTQFNGIVGPFRVWNVALTLQDLRALGMGRDPFSFYGGPVSYYNHPNEIAKCTVAWDFGRAGLHLPMVANVPAIDDLPSVLRRAPRPDRWSERTGSGALSALTALGAALLTGQNASCGLGIGMPDEL